MAALIEKRKDIEFSLHDSEGAFVGAYR